MKVCYDSINDVVSVYYNQEDIDEGSSESRTGENKTGDEYSADDAANLIIDTLDIYNEGKQIGFRVFNASRHYDKELLMHADKEFLSGDELRKMPKEKVIARFSMEKGNLYMP